MSEAKACRPLLQLSRVVVALGLASFGSGCAHSGARSGHAEGGLASVVEQAGVELGGSVEPHTYVAPDGRVVEEGEVDDGGWVLPLDIRRPRPPRIPPAPRSGLPAEAVASPLGLETRLGPDDGHTENETSIDALGASVVCGWNQFTDTTALQGVARSGDGGVTWVSQTLAGHDAISDPIVAAAGGGTWYFGYIARGGATGSDFEVFVRRSVDDGVSWQAPVAVTGNATFDDKPYFDAVGGEVLVAWADFSTSPSKIRAARSLDGGQSFGTSTVLAITSGNGNGASPLIAPDGDYYVFWRDSFQQSLWMAKSENQGATWSPDVAIVDMDPLPSTINPGGFRMVNLPVAAAAPDGTLVVLWNDQLFGDPDILSIRSTDGGASWSLPIRVNDDIGGAAQFLPWIDFDESGVGWAVWYDRRNDPAKIDVYLARTDDAGASWQPNQRVTGASFTPVLPSEGGAAAFIGDYNAIAASAGRVYPCFQDSRRGEQDVWVVAIDAWIFRDGFESGDTGNWSATVP